jgi:hypothetical protein
LKKAGSILLLIIFLFNTIGYKAAFYYLEEEADARIEAKIKTIDENDSQLITVKIPINLPYQTDWREFESIDGEMTFKGKTYRYVKRKVLRDTLILLCIKHEEKSQLQQARAEYYKKINDLTSDTKKPVVKQVKTDYYQVSNSLSALTPNVTILQQNKSDFTPQIAFGYPQKVKAPPRTHTA